MGVFVDSRGRGDSDKRIPEGLLLRFSKKIVFPFSHIKIELGICFEFLYIEEGGPDNVFLRVCFDVFGQVRVVIFVDQNRVLSIFFEFL